MDFVLQHWVLVLSLSGAGFAAGFSGGLFGVGGGIITTPVLYALFKALGHGDSESLKTAIGTSLAIIIVTSIRSLSTHHRAGHVDGSILRAWIPWIALGAGLGGILSRWAPVELLAIIFAAGAFWVAYRRLFKSETKAGSATDLNRKRMKVPLGIGTGLFSSLIGLGGGALGVMIMTVAGRPMHQAIGTSAGFGVAVAVPGVFGFIYSGLNVANLPPVSFGYFNFPAFVITAVMAAVAAPIGAKAAHRLNGAFLSKVFGGYVLIAACALAADVFWG
ncbi:sulfite exporter TauE/SafE family protein [Hyphococcus lacteus]|uniref:Probable membrane transporter protein n=1 Tax=Hyphococcus lacteus TaxID=3143536 RepID=A0ABV3Z4L1_9PROT